MRSIRTTFTGPLAIATLLSSTAAHAQSGAQLAARHELLLQAEQAAQANNHARALELAQHAATIQMSPSVRLFIAREEAAVGRFAPALGDAVECARAAEHDPTVPNRAAIVQQCRALADTLRPRIASVTVHVPDPAPAGLTVQLGGESLDPALYNVPAVVTPGDVTIDARAGDGRTYHQQIHIAAGASTDVNLALSAATAGGAGTSATGPTTAHETTPRTTSTGSTTSAGTTTAGTSTGATSAQQPSHATTGGGGGGTSPLRIGGLGVAALGVVLAGVGGAIWLADGSTYNRCAMTPCQLGDEPRGLDNASVVMFYSGVGLAVVGAALFLLAPSHPAIEHSTTAIWIDPRGAAGVTGSF